MKKQTFSFDYFEEKKILSNKINFFQKVKKHWI